MVGTCKRIGINVHDYLRRRPADTQNQQRELLALLKEQKRTNRLLQSLVYGGVGFLLGLVAMQWLVRIRLF